MASSSQKITSKNLSYDTSLPPFLARLHAQAAGNPDSPDPILAARRRPRGPGRSASEEAEDAPLVLDEHGNTVSLKVDDDGVVVVTGGKTDKDGAYESESVQDEVDKEEPVQKKTATAADATFGASGRRKRKAGKVVGDDEDGKQEPQNPMSNSTPKPNPKPTTAHESKPQPKKKAKKIKLSFGDDDDV